MSLIEDIKSSEGFSDKPYTDDKGIWTIGYGTNITTISIKEARLLLDSRLEDAKNSVLKLFGVSVMNDMNDTQKDSLYELMYWIGSPTFRKFKNMIKAIEHSDYHKAGNEMLDSRLGREYTTRANRLANKLKGY